jgi:adenine-specific DNA-methyltransferase
MRNRLLSAKQLLKPEGIICVQCDDNENAYLKILMDELFPNGFLNNVAVKMSEASGVKMNHAKGRFPKLKEYILIYKMPSFKGFITVDKYEQKEWDSENNIFVENLTQEQRDKLIELDALPL